MTFSQYLKTAWSTMLQPPWKGSQDGDAFDQSVQRGLQAYAEVNKLWQIHHPKLVANAMRWMAWGTGWAWTITGLSLGVLTAPGLWYQLPIAHSFSQQQFAIVLAVLSGVVLQFTAWFVMACADARASLIRGPLRLRWFFVFSLIDFMLIGWPVVLVWFVLHNYLTWLGPAQRAATFTFAWGLCITVLWHLMQAVLLPFIGKQIYNWLRSDEKASH